jgi:hypothetical protein
MPPQHATLQIKFMAGLRMVERAKGPSRLVQSVARWAITLGAAGTIVGATALYPVMLGNAAAGDRRGLLMLSGSLLSLAFVLAPFVRRTFANRPAARKGSAKRTLLDELRETPHAETAAEAASEAQTPPLTAETNDAPAIPLVTRVIVTVYAMFAAMLLAILWVLQTN